MNIGDTIRKDADIEEHINFSKEANEAGFSIEDKGDYYEAVEPSAPTEEDLAEQARIEAEMQRVPDLEDATVELADYVVSLEERIAELEAKLNG